MIKFAPTWKNLDPVYASRIEDRLTSFARQRGYDNIVSLCSYASDPDPGFAADGKRGVVLRSATWKVYATLQTGPVLAWEDVLAQLPALTWVDTSA